ncbi:MAG TPA: phenylacetic acid degradation protein PaaN [Candidatus Binatia bacterium]|nr:phenylacetic acid degradation protein PaaN [Candidatus Binatia bacterium]
MSTTIVRPSVVEGLCEKHRTTLDQAITAIATRGYWSAYSENPGGYPEADIAAGKAAFEAYRDRRFPLDQPGTASWEGEERSPYGFPLGVTYPHPDIDALLAAMQAALPGWRDAGVEWRAGICLEVLARLNARSHEIANAVMHTTGQAFGMAFQAGGPHAQERGLEAVAYAVSAMRRVPEAAEWVKPQGKRPPLRMEKRYHIVPRGLALVIGCNTFPTWNAYPGIFASLVTGNPVLVKPHPGAVLPLAITVSTIRSVLSEAGLDPNVICLAAERADQRIAASLATRPEIRIIDFTGSSAFGNWLEENALQAAVFTEKAGVNTVVIDGTDDYRGMLRNLAFTLSLYSGQMCTTSQNLLVPEAGISTDAGHRSFDEVTQDLARAIDDLLGDPARAAALLGAIVNRDVLSRLEAAASLSSVVRPSQALEHPDYPGAVVRTPLLVRLTSADRTAYSSECFGPVTFVIATAGTGESLDIWSRTLASRGALTAAVYATDVEVLERAERIAIEGGVALSLNLTDGVYVNQSAAFSDYHATGANPAANATLCDDAFVTPRFRVVQVRRHLPPSA